MSDFADIATELGGASSGANSQRSFADIASDLGGGPAPLRSNNPSALMPGGKMASYPSPEAGIAAMDANLQSYAKKGINTLAGVISRWAPPTDASGKPVNDTASYIADVSKRIGVDPNQPIDLTNPVVRHVVGAGIMLHENGPRAVFSSPPQARMQTQQQPAQQPQQTQQPPQSQAQQPAIRTGAAGIPLGISADGKVIYPDMVPAAPADTKHETWWDKIKGMAEAGAAAVTGATTGYLGGTLSAANNVAGTAAKLALGQDVSGREGPAQSFEEGSRALTYEPRTEAGQRYAGNIADASQNLVAVAPLAEFSAGVSAIPAAKQAVMDEAKSGIQSAKNALATKGATPAAPRIEPTMGAQAVTQNATAGAASPPINSAPPVVSSPPVEGGVAPAAIPDRAAVLKRIGLDNARTSAVTGDIAKAAQDFQVSKYTSEPAGLAAKAQFDAERQALVSHGENAVANTGGTLGLDQDSLNLRGQTIAKPFDSLRTWFENAKDELYGQAKARAAGMPTVDTSPIESLLNDRGFNNSAMAQDKNNLVSAIKNQLDFVKENNPQGLTVDVAEDFRKWLNKNWSPSNAGIIGQVKNAVDDSVLSGAGEDLYAKARSIHQLEKKTLDDPSGVSKLMDFDPKTPINRVTPYTKIPDTLSRLPPDQFKNVVNTLKSMPEELRPESDAALAEIRAHYANKMVDAGANNSGAWNAKRVSDFKKSNSANIATAFQDDPQSLGMLNDLEAAGHILSYPTSYPGASAQASMALKRGLMSGLTQRAGVAIGGGTGGFFFGPPGGAAGAVVGDAVASKLGASMAEKSALKKWNSGVTKLSDIAK